jgi:hypothetical protein
MKLWVDDVRPAPEGYYHARTVEEAAYQIRRWESETDLAWENYILKVWDREKLDRFLKLYTLTEISCDHDLGDGNADAIRLLDWLEATGRNYPIRIHSMNPVGVQNMRRIIEKNGWKEIK